MKNTKKQLFTAVAMLLVATVALGTATYAWFVNNAAVEVGNMEFQASASQALEIGVNQSGTGTGATTASGVVYGSLVATADIQKINNGYMTSFSAIDLRPASADEAALKAGRFFYDKTWNTTNSAVKTYGELTADTEIGYGVVKMVPLWFRGSQDMDVWLASGSAVTATVGAVDRHPGINSDQIDKALRVSFVSTSNGATTVKTFAFPGDTSKTVVGATNNSGGGNAGQAVTSVDTGTGAATFGAQNAYEDGFKVVKNTSNVWVEGDVIESGAAPIFNAKAGEDQLVKVYIWLEGCDEECVTAVSGGKVDVKLNFIGQAK
ncbi:hypothetical protein [Bacilliculturomica massiliensis]|uniref:hypothetical protein n=1 Tax=Bacilliculturomica massiliensis TaxID=1917867 RepID=UPI001030710B|nr:hypothetical protein [Bacilliculturomica massiliensis]